MASPQVSKKVKHLGSWDEDVFTDEIVKTIAALARSEKGKQVKVVMNLKGVKVTRSKLFQESQTTIFSIRDLRTVTRSPEFPQCVLLILSNVDKKYKIIALRCASEKDAVHLLGGFAEIQKHLQSSPVELKKKDNGNWTLRGRLFRRSRKRVKDVYSDRTPNGDIVTGTENGTVSTHRPGTDTIDAHTTVTYNTGVYTKRGTIGNSSSNRVPRKNAYETDGNADDDFIIETEVMSSPYATSEVHTRYHSDDIQKHRKGTEYASSKISGVDGRRLDSRRILEYSTQHVNPSPGVKYKAAPTSTIYSQPMVYREPPSRTYEARMETPVVYHPKSVQGRAHGSMQSEILPVRVWGGNWNMTFDQRSVRSNTSKSSQSRRKKSSDFYYPSTVVRSIENTYPRPPLVFRRGTDQIIAYRPGSNNYYVVETVEPKVNPSDVWTSEGVGKRH